jgi:Lar family restriction alleviation protein
MDKFDIRFSNIEKQPMDSTTLLPCPFCGGTAELSGRYPTGQFYISCIDCQVSMYDDRKDKVVQKWNRRKTKLII